MIRSRPENHARPQPARHLVPCPRRARRRSNGGSSPGLTDYDDARRLHGSSAPPRSATAAAPELVWLVEHPPLYTAGTSAQAADLLEPDRFPVFKTGRGGEYTYHGPGQRVAYVMLDLKRRREDVRAFVAALEDWIIGTLASFNVKGERREDRVGVWVARPDQPPLPDGRPAEDKIAAIGIRLRRWVSFHGIALNVEPDLSHFAGIVPCGVAGPRRHQPGRSRPAGDDGRCSTLALRAAFVDVFGPCGAIGGADQKERSDMSGSFGERRLVRASPCTARFFAARARRSRRPTSCRRKPPAAPRRSPPSTPSGRWWSPPIRMRPKPASPCCATAATPPTPWSPCRPCSAWSSRNRRASAAAPSSPGTMRQDQARSPPSTRARPRRRRRRRNLFLGADGKPLAFFDAVVGGRSVGVPGMPAAARDRAQALRQDALGRAVRRRDRSCRGGLRGFAAAGTRRSPRMSAGSTSSPRRAPISSTPPARRSRPARCSPTSLCRNAAGDRRGRRRRLLHRHDRRRHRRGRHAAIRPIPAA